LSVPFPEIFLCMKSETKMHGDQFRLLRAVACDEPDREALKK